MKKLYLLLTLFCLMLLAGCNKTTNDSNEENIISLKRGESVKVDVDGDKEDDLVTFEYIDIEDEFIGNYVVNINGDEFMVDACGPRDCMHLVKEDTRKKGYLIVIGEDGPSSDYASYIVRYNNHTFKELGKVGGVIDNDFEYSDSLEFHYDGTLTAPVRASIVQTWYYNADYEIKDDKIVKVEKDFYDVDYDTELLVDYNFYEYPNENSETLAVRSETILKFIGIDDEKWTKVRYLDLYGEETEAYFPVYYFCFMDENMDVLDSDVFKNLCMAD